METNEKAKELFVRASKYSNKNISFTQWLSKKKIQYRAETRSSLGSADHTRNLKKKITFEQWLIKAQQKKDHIDEFQFETKDRKKRSSILVRKAVNEFMKNSDDKEMKKIQIKETFSISLKMMYGYCS